MGCSGQGAACEDAARLPPSQPIPPANQFTANRTEADRSGGQLMRLGLHLPYWDRGPRAQLDNLRLTREAERLGFAVAWSAEAYGSDAATVLGWLAAQTERIGLGSAIFQIPARSPAMTAMTAATLDLLSDGRFRLGLGVSGPQVSEGWHGAPFGAPLTRTREYVDIVRMAL